MAEVGPLGAGELTERVTFKQRVPGVDAIGQPVTTLQEIAQTPTVWAKVRPTRSRERYAADQQQDVADIVVSARYRSDITSALVVVWRGKAFEIVGDPVDVSAGKHTLEIAGRSING